MHKFTRRLLTEWRKLALPFEDETLIAAVSGGADSCALALALHDLAERKKLRNKFVIAHFNHKLRGAESEADEKFVKNFAEKLNFEFIAGNPDSKSGISEANLEQFARNARYDFLREKAVKFDAFAVLTAHTLNDQAETFLLNLIRGSGLEGLGAMKLKRNLEIKGLGSNAESEIVLVRPMLAWAKREETENFCLENKIDFRRDAMNEDLSFRRVRVRKELLPLLRRFNPKIVETLAQTAFIIKEDFAELENCAAARIKELDLAIENAELPLKNLKTLSSSMRRQILRRWLRQQRENLRRLELKHIEALENLIFSRKSGKIIELPGGETIEKSGGKLIFQKTKVEK